MFYHFSLKIRFRTYKKLIVDYSLILFWLEAWVLGGVGELKIEKVSVNTKQN